MAVWRPSFSWSIPSDPRRGSWRAWRERWWERHGREVIEVRHAAPGLALAGSDDLEFAVSLGGDGTMLRTVELVVGAGVPVLGVNLGRMGYLTAVEPAGIEAAFEKMLAGDYLVEERMALEVELSGSAPGRYTALNDAIVERTDPGHTIHVAVEIAGRPVPHLYRRRDPRLDADGLDRPQPVGPRSCRVPEAAGDGAHARVARTCSSTAPWCSSPARRSG